MKIIKSVLAMPFLTLLLFAQFVDVQVEITSDKLPERERADLLVLEQQLPSYFEDYDWIENNFGIEIPLRIKIYPQSVNNSGFQRSFSGQFYIYNEYGDTRFLEKNFFFVYNTNQPLIHLEMTDPLTSPFDFYAYLFIACEMDTYDPLGGNPYFEKAREIASRALISEWPQGWQDRIKRLDEVRNLRDYRMFKYYYWQIVDLIDQGEVEQVPEIINKCLSSLKKVFEVNEREIYTHRFLDAHAREFITFLKKYGNEQQIKTLLELDPDNKEIYNAILEGK
ncbi:MAG: DUF4835 family protein [Candidatus Marinimicrobia bacterium]|nr:DUF4835 family protein [Candidatus Neomarinimicrobiota bacterium]